MDNLDWEEFVELHYTAIFAYCNQMLRSSADAEDAVQDTFLRAYKQLGSLKEKAAARAWVYTIARNVCLDKQRWWKRQLRHLSEHTEEAVDLGVPGQQRSEMAARLQRLIAALPLKQREVFVLRHWHGFSTDETADILGINTGTVKSHLKRAVDKLKQELEREE
jgi:RNA polymerase sigma-70 factor (ECF subfamily)